MKQLYYKFSLWSQHSIIQKEIFCVIVLKPLRCLTSAIWVGHERKFKADVAKRVSFLCFYLQKNNKLLLCLFARPQTFPGFPFIMFLFNVHVCFLVSVILKESVLIFNSINIGTRTKQKRGTNSNIPNIFVHVQNEGWEKEIDTLP